MYLRRRSSKDDDDEEAEALVLDHSFQPVNTTTDAEVGGKERDSGSRFPLQNSLDGPSAKDILLGRSRPVRRDHDLVNDAFNFPKDPKSPPKSSRRKVNGWKKEGLENTFDTTHREFKDKGKDKLLSLLLPT